MSDMYYNNIRIADMYYTTKCSKAAPQTNACVTALHILSTRHAAMILYTSISWHSNYAKYQQISYQYNILNH